MGIRHTSAALPVRFHGTFRRSCRLVTFPGLETMGTGRNEMLRSGLERKAGGTGDCRGCFCRWTQVRSRAAGEHLCDAAMMARPAPSPGLSRFSTSPRPVSAMTIVEFAVLDRRGDPQLALRVGVGVHDGVRGGLRDRKAHGSDPFGIHAAVSPTRPSRGAPRALPAACRESSPRTQWPSARPTRARPSVTSRSRHALG